MHLFATNTVINKATAVNKALIARGTSLYNYWSARKVSVELFTHEIVRYSYKGM